MGSALSTPAHAINECGPVSANALSCAPGTYAGGIVFDAGTPASPAPFVFDIGGAGQTLIGGSVGYLASQYAQGSVVNLNGPINFDGADAFISRGAGNHVGPLILNVNGDINLLNGGAVFSSDVASDVALNISGTVTAVDMPAFNAFRFENADSVTVNATGDMRFQTQLDPDSVFPFFTGRTGLLFSSVGDLDFSSTGNFEVDRTNSGGYGLFAINVARDVNLDIADFLSVNGVRNSTASGIDTGGISAVNVAGNVTLNSTGLFSGDGGLIQLINIGSADINVHDIDAVRGYAIEVGSVFGFGTRTGPLNITSDGLVEGAIQVYNTQGGDVGLDLNRFDGSLEAFNIANGSYNLDFNDARIFNSRITTVTGGNVAIDGGTLAIAKTGISGNGLTIENISGNVTIGGTTRPDLTMDAVADPFSVTGLSGSGFDIRAASGDVALSFGAINSVNNGFQYLAQLSDNLGQVDIDVTGPMTGIEGGGFLVLRNGGSVNVAIGDYAGNNISGFVGPVFSAVNIDGTKTGDVVATAGNISADGDGLQAFNTAGGNVTLTANDISSALAGLGTFATNGNVRLTARDIFSSQGPGIAAINTTGGDVTATGRDVSGDNGGIIVSNTTAGNVTINARNVTGRRFIAGTPPGFSAGDGIFMTNTSGTATLNLTGNVIGADSGIDISDQRGDVTINLGPAGAIGGINGPAISLLTAAGTANRINAQGNVFGAIVAGDGNDTFVNDRTWLVGLGGSTAIVGDLGGGSNLIVNNGIFGAGDLTATYGGVSFAGGGTAGDVTISNARFENNGAIILSNAAFSGRPTANGDRLTINGDLLGGIGSRLVVDASLGGPGSLADILTINGDLSGVTSLNVNNVNPGSGAQNTDGIVLVEVTGAANASNIVLDGGPISSGLFTYDLAFIGGTPPVAATTAAAAAVPSVSTFSLVSTGPSAAAATLPDLLGPGVSTMASSFDAWTDRQGDVRQFSERNSPIAGEGPIQRAWAKGFASQRDYSGTGTVPLGASSFSYNRQYAQQLTGVLAGVDVATAEMRNGDSATFGIMGGMANAQIGFAGAGTSAQFSGPVAGAYATYLNGPFYLDAAFQVDFLRMSADLGTSGSVDDVNAMAVGTRIETGTRFEANGLFIDPSVALTYASSHIDNISLAGANIGFNEGRSLAGRAALRVGKTFEADDGLQVTPSATLALSQEFLGSQTAVLTSGSASYGLHSTLPETTLDAEIGLDVSRGDFSAFARAGAATAKGLSGYSGQLGISLRL